MPTDQRTGPSSCVAKSRLESRPSTLSSQAPALYISALWWDKKQTVSFSLLPRTSSSWLTEALFSGQWFLPPVHWSMVYYLLVVFLFPQAFLRHLQTSDWSIGAIFFFHLNGLSCSLMQLWHSYLKFQEHFGWSLSSLDAGRVSYLMGNPQYLSQCLAHSRSAKWETKVTQKARLVGIHLWSQHSWGRGKRIKCSRPSWALWDSILKYERQNNEITHSILKPEMDGFKSLGGSLQSYLAYNEPQYSYL